MIQITLMTCMIMFSLVFTQMSHPLAMGLMLLIQTLLISLMTGLITKTFWFSYILFLIFLGGMLVLFIYVTSLASNEMFSLSMKMTLFIPMLLVMLLVMYYMYDNMITTTFYQNNEMMIITDMKTYTPENTLNLNSLYNYPTNYITILLMNYLLVTLIAIVKITNLFYGPLRTTN
uniref:NADH dehydrogenase subunit 6 n=1 Tax=Rivellia apicalis TaxID=286529 RepID=UPI0022FD66A3|nr:NADH dehydrogenase subunit 6 [Rivellia apicalis]WAR64265.1 NADH dehydrogenase subunit 6 [Rivellia apicalis]